MNSSVAPQPSAAVAASAPLDSSSNQETGAGLLPNGDYMINAANSNHTFVPAPAMQPANALPNSFLRHTAALGPRAAYEHPTAAYYAQAAPSSQQHQQLPLHRWHAPYPDHQQANTVAAWRPNHLMAPNQLAADELATGGALAAEAEVEEPEEENNEEGAVSDASEPDEAEGPADQAAQPDDGAGSQLDEVAKRRSFSEFVDDERERDRDGALVVKRRRHLVNGRPVAEPPESDDPDEEGSDELDGDTEASGGAEGGRERDFAALVAEIDRERAARPTGQQEAPQLAIGARRRSRSHVSRRSSELITPRFAERQRLRDAGESRLKATTVGRPDLSGGGGGGGIDKLERPVQWAASKRRRRRIKLKPRDQHEHRVHEQLEQRQWDDESGPSKETYLKDERESNRAAEAGPMDGAEQRGDTWPSAAVRGGGQEDEEAHQLELLAGDLMLDGNSERLELDRRRRDANSNGQVVEVGPQEEPRAILPRQNDETGGRGYDSAPLANFNWTANDPHAAAEGGHPASHRGGRPVGVGGGGQELSPLVANSSSQPVALEDLKVEILADPPRPPAQTATAQWPPQQQPAPSMGGLQTALVLGANPTGGLQQQRQQRVASGSHKNSSKVKKKKKIGKKKKSQVSSSSKYKAAKAFEQKRRSKKKMGQVNKRKRKSEKKFATNSKHFSGSTRGKKLAGGHGHRGAHKGKKYYKDKGYKKRGFKKSYHKLETGDHKTYFDEYRDKDQDNKWKKFDDKHKYSQSKKWSGHDAKRLKAHKLKEANGKASKMGHWKEKEKSMQQKHRQKMKKTHGFEEKRREAKKKKREKKEEVEGHY